MFWVARQGDGGAETFQKLFNRGGLSVKRGVDDEEVTDEPAC